MTVFCTFYFSLLLCRSLQLVLPLNFINPVVQYIHKNNLIGNTGCTLQNSFDLSGSCLWGSLKKSELLKNNTHSVDLYWNIRVTQMFEMFLGSNHLHTFRQTCGVIVKSADVLVNFIVFSYFDTDFSLLENELLLKNCFTTNFHADTKAFCSLLNSHIVSSVDIFPVYIYDAEIWSTKELLERKFLFRLDKVIWGSIGLGSVRFS